MAIMSFASSTNAQRRPIRWLADRRSDGDDDRAATLDATGDSRTFGWPHAAGHRPCRCLDHWRAYLLGIRPRQRSRAGRDERPPGRIHDPVRRLLGDTTET